MLGNIGPLVAKDLVPLEECLLLFLRPFGGAVDVWVEVVLPSLAALFADGAGNLLRDLGPVVGTVLDD